MYNHALEIDLIYADTYSKKVGFILNFYRGGSKSIRKDR